jgi:hypothetical protein
MNKTELAQMEHLKAMLALRHTAPVALDLTPPADMEAGLVRGFLPSTVTISYNFPKHAVSSSFNHGVSPSSQLPEPSSQGSIHMHSNCVDALKATRYNLEQRAAEALRQIDIWIAEEEDKQ